MSDRENECLVGLGGNIGDVHDTFRTALRQLKAAGCRISAVSSIYKTAAMGPEAGDGFLNAAARMVTTLPAADFLQLLRRVEDGLGRTRSVHWGPRTLDLDLLSYGDDVLQMDHLIVPHPGLWYRRFVLQPLVEIASDWRHPQFGLSILQLADRLNVQPLLVEIAGKPGVPRVPQQYRDRVELRHVGAAEGWDPAVFCRITCQPASSPLLSSPAAFLLQTASNDLPSQLLSVLDAALGECMACQPL